MTGTAEAVFRAVVEDDVPSLKDLVRAGADLEVRDERGRAPLHVATEMGAAAMVRALLSGGADVRAVDGEGNTALHAAARRGDVEMIDELFGAGALVDAPNRAGATPLGVARRVGHESAAAALVDRGADPSSEGLSVPDPD